MSSATEELTAQPEQENGQAPAIARVELGEPYAGKWVQYRKRMTGREFIALSRADVDPAGALEAVASRVVQHNLTADGKPSEGSILDLDLAVGFVIINAWNTREDADALDPPSAGSSPES